MNWDDMKVFLAIAGAGGLKKAATKLQIHHTSVARRIKIFEADLGVKLFDRLPAGYSLTPAGESLYQSANLIRQEFNTIEADLIGKDFRLEGDICLTIPHGFALHLLMPDIQEFITLYPGVNLKIHMTYAMSDLANREADVAIRIVNNPPDSLSGRRVAKVHWAAYASTQYLLTHDPVNEPKSCHWLGWGKASEHLNWPQKSNFPEIPVQGDLYSDVLQLAAIQQHMGIASLPCFMGDKAAGVQRITNSATVARYWTWILAHKDMATNTRVRVLIDFLYKALKKKVDLIEGVTK
jgi:DNA-binding transcriptional LysR family regulator